METKYERNLRFKSMTYDELKEQANKRFPELSCNNLLTCFIAR